MPPKSAQDITTIILDTSPLNIPNLPSATRGLCNLLERKILKKPQHETSIILYGTKATQNPVFDEFQAASVAQGFVHNEDGQYAHITVAHGVGQPDIQQMATLRQLEEMKDSVPGDFIDALFVAVDSMLKLKDQRPTIFEWKKQFIILSNFSTPLTTPIDDDTLEDLIQKLKDLKIQLHIISIDVPEDEAAMSLQAAAAKKTNMHILTKLCAKVHHVLDHVSHRPFLAGIFKAEEVGTQALMVTEFKIGSTLDIRVKLVNKAQQVKTPSLSKESPVFQPGEDLSVYGEGAGKIVQDKEYFTASDTMNPVPLEELRKCYRYGKQTVPIDQDDEEVLKYTPSEKGLKLLGFVPHEHIPRHCFMGAPLLVVANKDSPASSTALAALVEALHRKHNVAILRFVTAQLKVRILVGVPRPASPTSPCPHLICNDLPFAEDVRYFLFSPFYDEDRHADRKPSEEQLEAVRRLVHGLKLAAPSGGSFQTVKEEEEQQYKQEEEEEDKYHLEYVYQQAQHQEEELKPENTPNPALHRFMTYMVDKAVLQTSSTTSQQQQEQEQEQLVDSEEGASLLDEDCKDALLDAVTSQTAILESMKSTEAFTAISQLLNAFPNLALATSGGESTSTAAAAAASKRAVYKLRKGREAEDFEIMMNQGNSSDALSQLRKHIQALIDSSMGDANFQQALELLTLMRRAAVKCSTPVAFNNHFKLLCEVYSQGGGPGNDFIQALKTNGAITLISSAEVPDLVEVTPEEATAFLDKL